MEKQNTSEKRSSANDDAQKTAASYFMMVKLTADLICQARQFTNPVRDRELDLRGYKIPLIENLGATLDQFDTIDISSNDLRRLDGFPLLSRLVCILANNNRISRISENLECCVPRLEQLILTNNNVQDFAEIESIASLKKLKVLSLLRNPVTTKRQYRLFTIYHLPQLRLLDFQRIRLRERQEADRLFKSRKGKDILKDVKRTKTFVPGAPVGEKDDYRSNEDIDRIRKAIVKASSLEEVDRLNAILQSGRVPTVTENEMMKF